MRLIGEVWRLPCPHCHNPIQVVLEPHANCVDPKILPDDHDVPQHIIRTSMFGCPHCTHQVVILGKLIFVVGDVEEFDEIEQHR